jgi:hypothetical protein
MTPHQKKRTALALAVAFVVGAGLEAWDRYRCWRHGHDTYRHPLGFFACKRCTKKAADLGGFGMSGGGYLSPSKRWRA